MRATWPLTGGVVGDDHDGGARARGWPCAARANTSCAGGAVELAGRLVGEQHLGAGSRARPRSPPAAARRRTSARGRRSAQCADAEGRPAAPRCAGAALAARHARRASSAGRRSGRRSGRAAGCARSAAGRSRRRAGGSAAGRRRVIASRSWPATRARPAVGASRPERMSSVDLPEPEAPTIGDHLAGVHQQVEALQRLHLDGLGLVDAHQVVADDQRVVTELGRPFGGAHRRLLPSRHVADCTQPGGHPSANRPPVATDRRGAPGAWPGTDGSARDHRVRVMPAAADIAIVDGARSRHRHVAGRALREASWPAVQRQVLPIPDRSANAPATYDAKDPDTSFPPIEPLRPPGGRAERAGRADRRLRLRRVQRVRRAGRTPRRSTGWPARDCGTPASTPPRCARRPGRRCCRAATTTPSGMGGITEIATSAPGYSSLRPNNCAPLAETLKLNGYSTAQFGKCHEVPVWQTSPMGPVRQLAVRRRRVRALLRLHRRRDQPVRARRSTRHHAGRARPDAGGGLPLHRGHDRPRDRLGPPAEGADAGQAVLRLLRARRHPRPAPRPGRVVGQVPRAGSTRAGTRCARRPSPGRRSSAWSRSTPS